jgi:hypothetical protein
MTFARDLASFADSATQNLSFRNLIINGDMQVAQRGTSVASITTSGYRTADRWNSDMSSLGTWTQSVENDASTGSGFRKSLKMLCTTADASPAAGDYIYVNQVLEGQNLQQIAKGTSSAKQLTVSFWVKSNVTGTYILEFYDVDNTRQTSKSYTVSVSGVWEYKTITFAADTTGAFDNDNAASLGVNFWLSAGTNFTSGTLQSTWVSSTTANRAVGQVNLAASINNYWQVTGVQLEVGPAPTPFEFLPAQTKLALCQRYYSTSIPEGYTITNFPGTGSGTPGAAMYATGSNDAFGNWMLPVPMRTTPTTVIYSGTNRTSGSVRSATTGTDYTCSGFGFSTGNNKNSIYISGFGAGVTSGLILTYQWTASAEL